MIDPQQAFLRLIRAAHSALELMERHDLNDLRTEVAHYAYRATRFDRKPQSPELTAACRELWAALGEMVETGWDGDRMTVIQKLEDEFFVTPNLEEMHRAADLLADRLAGR